MYTWVLGICINKDVISSRCTKRETSRTHLIRNPTLLAAYSIWHSVSHLLLSYGILFLCDIIILIVKLSYVYHEIEHAPLRYVDGRRIKTSSLTCVWYCYSVFFRRDFGRNLFHRFTPCTQYLINPIKSCYFYATCVKKFVSFFYVFLFQINLKNPEDSSAFGKRDPFLSPSVITLNQ